MPTYEFSDAFRADYRQLTRVQKTLVKHMVRLFVEDLRQWEATGMVGRPQFRAELRVKNFVGVRGLWEVTWSWPDGRATFIYGPTTREGKCHIVWRRIGSHRIFKAP